MSAHASNTLVIYLTIAGIFFFATMVWVERGTTSMHRTKELIQTIFNVTSSASFSFSATN